LRKSSNRLELVEGELVEEADEAAGVAEELGDAEATCDSAAVTVTPSKISAAKNPTIRWISPSGKKRFSL